VTLEFIPKGKSLHLELHGASSVLKLSGCHSTNLLCAGTNLRPILPVLAKVFDQALEGGGAKNINFQELAADLAQITFDYPFRIPPYFACVPYGPLIPSPVIGLASAARRLMLVHPERSGKRSCCFHTKGLHGTGSSSAPSACWRALHWWQIQTLQSWMKHTHMWRRNS
jgi:hypothetical protein